MFLLLTREVCFEVEHFVQQSSPGAPPTKSNLEGVLHHLIHSTSNKGA